MPEKPLSDFTRADITKGLDGKTDSEKIKWLQALQNREEREMKKYGSAIEWERKGLGLPANITPLDDIAGIERAQKRKEKEAAKPPTGSVIVFSKKSAGSRRRRRGRRVTRKH
jgi:hypothetical protein